MSPALVLVIIIVAVALIFDYLNGFHDAANSVATVVATRVLTPLQAVIWAAFFNFVAAFSFGTAVANTVGKGMVDLRSVTVYVILAGLIGAIVWDLITWWFGLPTSSSHALFGGYAGAAMARNAFAKGFQHSMDVLIWSGWIRTLLFMVLSPLIGLVLAYGFMIAVYWLFRKSSPKRMDVYFRKLQLVSAAAFSYAHGTNDAQKTMGIITGVLVTTGFLGEIPRASLGDPLIGRRYRPRNAQRRLAHHTHDGLAHYTPAAARGLLRRGGGGEFDSDCDRRRRGRFHHPCHHRRDHRRRVRPAAESRPLGRRQEHRMGLGPHDTCRGRGGLDLLFAALFRRSRPALRHEGVDFTGSCIDLSAADER